MIFQETKTQITLFPLPLEEGINEKGGASKNGGNTAMLGLACFLFCLSNYSTDNLRIFFFFRLKDREEENDKIKGIHSWGKTKDEGVRATIPLIFFLFQLEY